MTLDHEHDSSVDIDEDVPEYEPEFGYGTCRACKQRGNISCDSGYCTDCD
ncbi:MAG: hypothetical protein H8D23_09565 [Candidatus Brocadiales bacterium]|nr:hypothetical protein [Candidatus Brocadiales bacterium]